MSEPSVSNESAKSDSTGSPLALGGLLYGIGILDAEEVLRYMDATFRRQAAVEGEPPDE